MKYEKGDKNMKRILSVFLSIMLLMGVVFTVPVFAANVDEGDGTGGDVEEPAVVSLAVVNFETRILTPGNSIPFKFQVQNFTAGSPYDMRVRVEGEGEYASKFSLDTDTGWDTIEEMVAKTRFLRVSSDLPDGAYTLNFTFAYTLKGMPMTANDRVTVYVQNTKTNVPYIKSTSFNKTEIGKDNKAKLTAKIVNPMSAYVSDVRVSLDTELSQGFTLYENFQPVTFSSINGNSGTQDATFSVYVASSVSSGNYPIVFNISYKDRDGVINTIKAPVYAEVVRTADAETGDGKGSQPRIIVSNYSIDVDTVEAGKPFELSFTLQNTSASSSVGNIKVTVGSDTVQSNNTTGSNSAVFFPAEGSNSFFIEAMKPKGVSSHKIKLMANSDVQPGVYPVVLNIVYDSGNETENISFPVSQPQRLDIIGLTIPTDSMGGMVPITFQYINKGKATINNFTIAAEGDFTLDGGDTYIGNLTAGYNDYFDSSLISNGTGELKGAIVFKYEDSQGEPKEQRTEFTVNVMPMEENMGMIGGDDPMGMLPEGMVIDPETGMLVEAGGGFPWAVVIIVGIVVIAGGLTTFIIIRKKKKAKKVLVDDEED